MIFGMSGARRVRSMMNRRTTMDLNYITNLLQLPAIHRCKTFEPITTDIKEMNRLKMCNMHVFNEHYKGKQLKYKHYKTYETVIVQSDTGTGKTTAVAMHAKRYAEETKSKFLTITDKVSMSDQHVLSFEAMDMKSYQDFMRGDGCSAYTCCINSLYKRFGEMSEHDMKQYTVYIDEITSFVQNFTHNEKL